MAARGELVSDRDLDARIAVQTLTSSATRVGLAAEDRRPPLCRRAPGWAEARRVLAPQRDQGREDEHVADRRGRDHQGDHDRAKLAFYSSPAIGGPAGRQVLIIANITGHVYALNLATGATLRTQQPDTAGYWTSPTISQGTITSRPRTASYWPSPSPAPNGSFAFTNPGPVSAFAYPVLPMPGQHRSQ